MLRLAIGGREGFHLDLREVRREGVSYSSDTANELLNENPDAELFMIIGSDSLASMPRWHQPSDLLSKVQLAVVQRGGDPETDFSVLEGLVAPERIEQFRGQVIAMPQIELSSREIRGRVGQGRSIRYRVPNAVAAYIRASGIYQSSVSD